MGDARDPAGEGMQRALFLAGLGALYRTSRTEFEALREAGRTAVLEAGGPAAALAAAHGPPRERGLAEGVAEPAVAAWVADGSLPMLSYAGMESITEPAPDHLLSPMIEAMLPDLTLPSPAAVLQARRNGAARLALAKEHGFLTSGDIADLNQSAAKNRAALANRWKREGRVFAVEQRGADLFPAFQLDERGQPREVIARVLAAMGGARGWETALWFTAANPYLDDQRPVDLLAGAPERVVGAAEQAAAEVYF